MFARRRPLLRAAVVGGGAYAAGKRRAEKSAQEAGQDAGVSESVRPQDGNAGAASASDAQLSVSGQLEQLSRLHEQGALTDAEFASAKARILAS